MLPIYVFCILNLNLKLWSSVLKCVSITFLSLQSCVPFNGRITWFYVFASEITRGLKPEVLHLVFTDFVLFYCSFGEILLQAKRL